MNRMRGFLVISLLMTLMISLTTMHTDIYAQDESLTVSAFKGIYSVGMTVTLFGNVTGSFTADDKVSVKVTNPTDQVYRELTANLDEEGSYTVEFKLEGAEASALGIHTVESTYKTFIANTSFEVKEKPIITISLDKETYDLGDFVIVSGKVTPRILAPIEIRIYGFNNTLWQFVPINAQSIATDGTFTVEAGELLGKNVKAGKYRVEASYAYNLATASLEFDVKLSGKAVVGGLMAVDVLGQKLDEIFIGQQVLFQADVQNILDEKQSFAFLVLIKDADGITISLSWISGILPASETLAAAQSWVPDEEGSFTVEVFLWESVSAPVPLTNKVPRTDLIVQA